MVKKHRDPAAQAARRAAAAARGARPTAYGDRFGYAATTWDNGAPVEASVPSEPPGPVDRFAVQALAVAEGRARPRRGLSRRPRKASREVLVERLSRAQDVVSWRERQLAEALEYRDALVVVARELNIPWEVLAASTGLSRQALRKRVPPVPSA